MGAIRLTVYYWIERKELDSDGKKRRINTRIS